jgi:hypothetical protein
MTCKHIPEFLETLYCDKVAWKALIFKTFKITERAMGISTPKKTEGASSLTVL